VEDLQRQARAPGRIPCGLRWQRSLFGFSRKRREPRPDGQRHTRFVSPSYRSIIIVAVAAAGNVCAVTLVPPLSRLFGIARVASDVFRCFQWLHDFCRLRYWWGWAASRCSRRSRPRIAAVFRKTSTVFNFIITLSIASVPRPEAHGSAIVNVESQHG